MVSPPQFKNRNWIKYQQTNKKENPYTAEKKNQKEITDISGANIELSNVKFTNPIPKIYNTKQYFKYINNKRAKQLNAYSFYLCNHHWNRPHWIVYRSV